MGKKDINEQLPQPSDTLKTSGVHAPQNAAETTSIFPILLIAAFAAGIILFYVLIDPSQHLWTLKCPLYLFTGIECPACGMQRAIHALLHGNISLSLRHNAFFVISIPYLIALTVAEGMKHLRCGSTFRKWVLHPLAIKTYIVLCIIWGILRNLLNL